MRGHQYEHAISSYVVFAIGAENLLILMLERAIPVWEQVHQGRLPDGTALHSPTDQRDFILPAFPFCYRDTFAFHSIPTLRIFYVPVQDRGIGPGFLTLCHSFNAVDLIEIAKRVINVRCWIDCNGASIVAWGPHHGFPSLSRSISFSNFLPMASSAQASWKTIFILRFFS